MNRSIRSLHSVSLLFLHHEKPCHTSLSFHKTPRHATLDIHTDGTVWLTDLGSTNGTFVEGIQIFGMIQLVDRQEFTCGKSTFMLLIRKEDSLNMD